jgi:eukaryotic-like serine/threonine-protein kinase
MISANSVVDGRYRIINRLGSGGMAEVWCAEDTELDRKVALKILEPRFAQDREFVERFRREASAAAGLQHPNVVSVFDRGEFDGTYYIAMEYVEGASLRELINRGMSVEAAVRVTRQILAAAKFAHSHGVIHRDLKPGNVLVDRHGRATVTDFGIAKAGVSEITQAGSVMGTAQYLSPEQAQGLEVTAASDLYSIGVVLYEALTGQVPFEADSAVAVALKQVSEMPRPPSELNPDVPRGLDAVVLKALAKDPANRFASVDEFSAALDAAEKNPSVAPFETAVFGAPPVSAAEGTAAREAQAPPPAAPPESGPRGERRRRPRWRWAIIAVLVAALVGVAVWALTRPSQIVVPSVIGQREGAAVQALEGEGFDVDVARTKGFGEPGRVSEQDPRPGEEATEGSTVTITVVIGPGVAEVPDVEGLPQRKAVGRLDRAGFRVKSENRFSETVPAGRAIGTDPAESTELARDSTVTLQVSKGPNLVDVPSVLGLDQAIAESRLRRADLVPNVETDESAAAEGTVITQDPGGGAVPRGSEVTIVVSTGIGRRPRPRPDRPQPVAISSVIGQSQQAARATLRAQGLKVSVVKQDVRSEDDDGVVIDQAPPDGTRVPPGSTVTIVVGKLEEPTIELPPEG